MYSVAQLSASPTAFAVSRKPGDHQAIPQSSQTEMMSSVIIVGIILSLSISSLLRRNAGNFHSPWFFRFPFHIPATTKHTTKIGKISFQNNSLVNFCHPNWVCSRFQQFVFLPQRKQRTSAAAVSPLSTFYEKQEDVCVCIYIQETLAWIPLIVGPRLFNFVLATGISREELVRVSNDAK